MTEYILIALAAGNLMLMIIGFYKMFHDPDESAEKQLGISKVACIEKHKRVDEIIIEFKESVKGINYTFAHFKENEFRHIEEEMRRMSDVQTRILTILEERDKAKQLN